MAALELPFAFGAMYWLPVSHGRKVEVRYHRQQIVELKKKIAWHEEKVQAVK